MITSVRSIAIPKERTNEKLVIKLSESPNQLRVSIEIRNARGIEIAAMRDSLIPIKKNTQPNTRINVCIAFHPRFA
jgi:hypothetical protein